MYRHCGNYRIEKNCPGEKNNLPKQFTRLVEIRFYVTYFPESVSSIQSRQKNVLS